MASSPLLPTTPPYPPRHQLGKQIALKYVGITTSFSIALYAIPSSISAGKLTISFPPSSPTQILAASLFALGSAVTSTYLYLKGKSSNQPNYAKDPNAWFAYPPSDSQKPADLFYAHPTTHAGLAVMNLAWEDSGNTCTGPAAGDPDLLANQASAFAAQANVYMPKYRQMGFIAQGKDLETTDDNLEGVQEALDLAAEDLERAFTHFLNNRPDKSKAIIVAGHSQGAILLSRVLATCLSNNEQSKCLVAAYLCGGYIPTDLFGPSAPLGSYHICTSPTDTNCVIAYDTRTPSFKPESLNHIAGNIGLWAHNLHWLLHKKYCSRHSGTDDVGKARVQINPMTWTAEGSAEGGGGEYLGARMTSVVAKPPKGHPKGELKLNAPEGWGLGTVVNNYSVCIGEDVEEWWPGCSKHGNLHPIDVHFWWYNLEENVATRLAAWLEKNK